MLSKETIAKLREVKAAILANPKFYIQDAYIAEYADIPTTCGTTCCIAGWADFIVNGAEEHNERAKKYLVNWLGVSWRAVGSKALGLTQDQTYNLFSSADEWPSPFSEQYYTESSPEHHAKTAAKRIDFFIKTNGTDILEA